MIEIEKMGKPAVPIVSGRFEEDAIASSRAFAMPDLQFVIVPRIYRNLALDECVRQTELAFDELVSTLTSDTDERNRDQYDHGHCGSLRLARHDEGSLGEDLGRVCRQGREGGDPSPTVAAVGPVQSLP